MTSALTSITKFSKKCLSLYPVQLKPLNPNPISIGFSCPTVCMKKWLCLAHKAVFVPFAQWVQGAGGALCLHWAVCPCDVCGTCTRLNWGTLEANPAAVYQCWVMLWHSLGQETFVNWTFWHISLGPHGAQKINFLSGFTTGVYTQALIMPFTEKDQIDAWRQLSSGSTAQNHLNPTTFVQDAVCSAYQSFLWIIFAKKKQTYSN